MVTICAWKVTNSASSTRVASARSKYSDPEGFLPLRICHSSKATRYRGNMHYLVRGSIEIALVDVKLPRPKPILEFEAVAQIGHRPLLL